MQRDIREAAGPEDVKIVQDLVLAYIPWLYDSFPHEIEDLTAYYSPDRVQSALDEVSTTFVPPHGLALIARLDGTPVGCAMAHPIEPGVSELKRLFVLPSARGHGFGRAMIESLLQRMAQSGHPTMRLDTAIFLTDAIALYRQIGFVEIEPYNEMPAAAAKNALYMEFRH